MVKLSLTVLFIALSLSAFSQDSTITRSSKPYHSLRLGAGVERSPFIEVGFSRLSIADKGLNSGSLCFYGSGQFSKIVTESQSNFAYGGKVGFETAWMIGMLGAELKFLTTGEDSQWFLTPRVGLSLLGAVSLSYGLNLPTQRDNLTEIGQHQISLTANLSRRLIKDSK